jgi:hypothetical protein
MVAGSQRPCDKKKRGSDMDMRLRWGSVAGSDAGMKEASGRRQRDWGGTRVEEGGYYWAAMGWPAWA